MTFNSRTSYNTGARYNVSTQSEDNAIDKLKQDVSDFSGIDKEKLAGFGSKVNYFMAVINSNVNVAQFHYDIYGAGKEELPDILYNGVLVPMLADYYTEIDIKGQGIIKTITEGDSSIAYDVSALIKTVKKNYRPFYVQYRKLVTM